MDDDFGSCGCIRLRVDRSLCFDRFDLHAIEGTGDNARCIRTVEAVSCKFDQVADTKLLSFDEDAAQRLMDDLWRAGIRPTEAAIGHDKGELASVREHLDDMRRLAFGTMKIDEPDRQRNVR